MRRLRERQTTTCSGRPPARRGSRRSPRTGSGWRPARTPGARGRGGGNALPESTAISIFVSQYIPAMSRYEERRRSMPGRTHDGPPPGAQAWLRTRSERAQDGPGTARRPGPIQTPSLDAPARFWRLLACMERLRRRRGAAARGRNPHRQAPATVGKYDSKLSTGACMVGAEARRGARARETGRLDGSGRGGSHRMTP